jgi:GTPase SAR1 family protein
MCAVLKGGLPFHSSAIAFGDRGIAFSGPSGAGKSTLANMLVSPAQLLNDDYNIILPLSKKTFGIYSTPFTTKETPPKCVKRGVHLRTIFFIEKSPVNKIEDLPFNKKYLRVLGQTFILSLSDFFGKKILDNAGHLCECVECKRLCFNNDGSIRPFMYRYAGGLK